MPQMPILQTAFNSGEFSPLAIGRSDIAAYKNALAKCRNMVVTPVGPAQKRPCTRYVAPVANEDYESRLVAFAYSNVQAYILEFGHQVIRFFTPAGVGGWVIPSTVPFQGFRIDLTANTIGVSAPHYLKDGAGPFRVTSDNTLPTGLLENTNYYVVLAAAGAGAASFALSLTPGGAAVNITGAGTLTGVESHYLIPNVSVIQAITSPYTIEEAWELDFVPSGDILYITHQNHPPKQLERRQGNGFILRDIFFIDGPYDPINTILSQTMDTSAAGGLTQSRPNVFSPGDVSLNTETPANVITIPFHGYKDRQGPTELRTTGALPAGLVVDTPYFIQLLTDHTFQLNAVAGDLTPLPLTTRGTGVHTIEGRSVNTLTMVAMEWDTATPSTDEGRRFRYRESIDATTGSPLWAWGIISTISTAYVANVQVHRMWATDVARSVFRLGAFYTGNYPAFCAVHEQRLWLAATPSSPNTLYGSQVGDFEHHAPDEGIEDFNDTMRVVTVGSAIVHTLGSGQVDKLAWLTTVRQLIIGTTGAIWPVQASRLDDSLTQANINSHASAVVGSALVKPVTVSDEIIYLSASGHKLLATGFNFESDGFLPDDLSVLASHFTEKRITQLAYAQEPYSIIWGCRSDGLLLGITYERTQKVLGWHAHELGGVNSKVRSVAVAKDDQQDYDQLWMVVERTINGSTRRYIEFTERPFFTDSDLSDAPFLDSSLVPYEGSPVSQVSNLAHLEGESVFALADGIWRGPLTVTGGIVNLPEPASKVRVGLNYNAYVKVLPLEMQVPGGTLIDRTQRLIQAFARLHRTNYVQIGLDLDSMKSVPMRKMSDDPAIAIPLRTVDVDLLTDHGSGTDQSFYIGSDKPVPLDLIGIVGRLEWGVR